MGSHLDFSLGPEDDNFAVEIIYLISEVYTRNGPLPKLKVSVSLDLDIRIFYLM